MILLSVAAAIAYRLFLAPIPVRKHVVGSGEIVAEVMGTGTLEARRQAVISPKISGRIIEVLVDQGDSVQAGDVLFRLDNEDLKQQAESSESSLDVARAGVERQAADRQRARAVLDQARIEYRRVESLVAQSSASRFELDKATEGLRIAEADLSRSEAALVEAHKQVTAAEKTREFHRARLADSVVSAPFNGLIVRRDRDPGSIVVPGSSVLGLISTDELWISAWVDETEMDRLRPGQRARVLFRSQPNEAYVGEVARLGREADRETREFLVDVWVRQLPVNWAVGQRAEVYIEIARKPEVILLPAHLVTRREGRAGVFVMADGKAAWREIRLGLRGRETVEVLEGLERGDTVVFTSGPKATPIVEGRRVAIR